MRHRKGRLARLLALAGSLLSVSALAQVRIEPDMAGQQGTFGTDGNLTVDGHCFGNVSSVPSGGVLGIFSGKISFKNGSLFLSGSLNELSTTFPGGIFVRNGSTTLASMTSTGRIYLRGTCINSSGCSNTKFEPAKWNDGGLIQNCNNCYNYANDTRTDNYAQPGYASGHQFTDYTVDAVRTAALWDGLQWVGWDFPGNAHDCGIGHLLFMSVSPGIDYHWLRLDQARGRWSHKIAQQGAQDTWNNKPITNPLVDFMGSSNQDGGFYCTCGSKANIAGPECPGGAAKALAAPSTDSQAVYSVELDAFSGRPNPTFSLSPAEARTLTLRRPAERLIKEHVCKIRASLP